MLHRKQTCLSGCANPKVIAAHRPEIANMCLHASTMVQDIVAAAIGFLIDKPEAEPMPTGGKALHSCASSVPFPLVSVCKVV